MDDILIIRQSAFGDVLHVLPAIEALRRSKPGARISLLTKPRFAFLGERSPFVDETWSDVRRPVDLVVDCQGLYRTALLARRVRARARVGYSWRALREKPAALFYDRRVAVPPGHVIDMHARLLAGAAGLPVAVDPGYRATFLVRPDPAVTAFLGRVPAPRALVHPLSSQAGKHLDAAAWEPVLQDLVGRGFAPILSCGPGEEAFLDPWRRRFPGAFVMPVLPLEALPALVDGCALCLAADTGVLHLADQLGKACLSRFTLWPPERNGPYFSPRLVFHRRPPDPAQVRPWLDSLGAPFA